jgi:hypothetical protein
VFADRVNRLALPAAAISLADAALQEMRPAEPCIHFGLMSAIGRRVEYQRACFCAALGGQADMIDL